MYNYKLREIIDWERQNDGLLYFLVKFEFKTGDLQSVWLPIHRIPQLCLSEYLHKEVQRIEGNLSYFCGNEIEEKTYKVKVLKNLAYSSSQFELIKELFISEENPRFLELKNRVNKLEEKLANLPQYLSSSSSGEINDLLTDVILQRENLITKYEAVKMDELIEMEAKINVDSNDAKPIRLSRYIRQCDINSLKHTSYVNTILIPPSLAELDIMKKRVSCSCTGEICQLDKCSHYENVIPAYNADGRLVSNYLEVTESIHHYKCDLSCLRRTKTIHECNSDCSCGPSCPNRVIQNGSTVQKEIFSTLNGYGIGLGVRTLEDVKKGSFIGTYAGRLITNEESKNLEMNRYLFEVASSEMSCSSNGVCQVLTEAEMSCSSNGVCQVLTEAEMSCSSNGVCQVSTEAEMSCSSNEVCQVSTEAEMSCSSYVVCQVSTEAESSRGDYIIDASRYGNITRLMNHSHSPNVTTLYAHIEISDPRVHDIVFFAQRDIKKGEELCIHYGNHYFGSKDKCYCVSCCYQQQKKKEMRKEEI